MRPAGIGWITELRRFDWRSAHCGPDELPGGGGLEGSRRGEHDCVCVPPADQLQAASEVPGLPLTSGSPASWRTSFIISSTRCSNMGSG